jgi:hypothetical protein
MFEAGFALLLGSWLGWLFSGAFFAWPAAMYFWETGKTQCILAIDF